jgi:hypothetical protein
MLLDNFLPGGEYSPDVIAQYSEAFHAWHQREFPNATLRHGLPVQASIQGREIQLSIDWVIDFNGGTTIIQEILLSPKQFSQQREQLLAQASLRMAVLASNGIKVSRCFLHHIPAGSLLEVAIAPDPQLTLNLN